jgi:hypothetical protein
MKYQLLFFFFIFFLSNPNGINAQSNKVVYAEALGNGFIVASLNYDQRFGSEINGLGYRVGVSIAEFSRVFSFPVMINYLIGNKMHFLELGLGALYFTDNIELSNKTFDGLGMTSTIMYRYQASGGFVLRVGLTPFLNNDNFVPAWFGLALGYRF